tara:strand:- start:26473 stop:27183 length:711 start_codon:yes stop_codon:yes gene_type:complete
MIAGEIVCKLDGHTRAYLWERGELQQPKRKLTVHIFECEDMDEVCELYTHFDNQSSVEAARDRLYGACRENKFNPGSVMLRHYKFVVALQCASKGGTTGRQSEYKLIPTWIEELNELDSWNLGGMVTSLIALALVLIANGEKDKAKEFFQHLDDDTGIKTEKGNDGVQALSNHMDVRRAGGTLTGWDNINELFERAYYCYSAYRDDKLVKSVRRTARDVFCKVDKSIKKDNQDGSN